MSLTNEDLQKIGEIVKKQMNDEVPKLMTTFWEEVSIPWLEKTLVSKKELKVAFENFSINVDQKFNEVNARISRLGDRVNILSEDVSHVDKRLCRVEEGVIAVRRAQAAYISRTEQKLASHVEKFRQVYGVAESLPNYTVSQDEKK